jgi:glycosyltransferase involved in cell wall biosynthesis
MSPVAEGKKIYPKVLIIGHNFNFKDGGGITLSNLFMGWPKNKIAVADNRLLYGNIVLSVCVNYYQLGYQGKLHPFPINIFLPKIKSGPVNVCLNEKIERQGSGPEPGKHKRIYKLLKIVMDFLGVYNFLYRIPLTDDFLKWVQEYDPDVIYSPLSTLELIRLVSDLNKKTGKPIALHILDDWPSVINRPGLMSIYWKTTIDREFRQLINRSSFLMSISESMTREYKARYGKWFVPFHNPINLDEWLPHSKKDWGRKGSFTVLYAGRIGVGMKNSIVEFARCIHELSVYLKDLVFEIQTNDISLIKDEISLNDHVKWVKPMPYKNLPRKFSSVDLLLLPVDFDHQSLKFLNLSFQTKISEYMISGTPVIVYADKTTEVARFASEEGWACLVNERNHEKLKEAIVKLYEDESLRKSFGSKAVKIASEKEDSLIVRERFRDYLSNKQV